MPAVLDLVGNMFNVQAPGDLDGAVSVRLAAIVTPGAAGPAVDLDALLLLLVREYNSGGCGRLPGRLWVCRSGRGWEQHWDIVPYGQFTGCRPFIAVHFTAFIGPLWPWP